MGMASKDFWDLTWWEWNLKLLWLHKENRRRLDERELHLERTRQFMTLFAAVNRGKNSPVPKPQDFFVLSYDKKEKEEAKPEPGGLFKQMKVELGSRIKDGIG